MKTARAFTLIELLVVIAIIALLVSIALPALSRARQSAGHVREAAGLKQFITAFSAYSTDNRGDVLPGFTPLEWVTPGAAPGVEVKVFTNDTSQAARVYSSTARRFPWRIAAYLGYAQDALVVDKRLRAEFAALPDRPDTRDGYQWAFANSTSFGMNTTYVGGDARRGGFFQPAVQRWGKYYVSRMDEPKFADRLMVFATSRGYHPIDGASVIPARHRIEGPWQASHETAQIPTFARWGAPAGGARFDASRSPETYGYVDFRQFGKAAVAAFDGHCEVATPEDLSDMRRWCNLATTPDWRP